MDGSSLPLQDDQAREILQDVLDTGSRALLSEDPNLFMRHVALPFVVITEDTEHLLRSRSETVTAFNSASATLRGQGVTDYIRIVTRARVKSSGAICGEWMAHALRCAHRVLPPFPARGQLILEDGIWKFSHTSYGVYCPSLPDRLPDVADTPSLRALNLTQ